MQEQPSLTIAELNHIAGIVLDSAISVHKEMGPGLLEVVYQHCLVQELKNRQLRIDTMVPIQLWYKGQLLNKQFIIDILVENEIIIELKAIEGILPVHEAQIISYLKLSNKRLGFLVNFNVPLLKNGFKRFVNNLR
jgi:GxxExxY protein